VRVHIPENNHSIFLQTALPDGDIDYRFAISAMLDAGYKGYLALEGTRKGDTLSKDDRSVAYVNALLKELGKGK
jgi:sugar phosphate isomerase/epimerase